MAGVFGEEIEKGGQVAPVGIQRMRRTIALNAKPLAPILDGADQRGLGRDDDPGFGKISS
jgi:hypothetical protein